MDRKTMRWVWILVAAVLLIAMGIGLYQQQQEVDWKRTYESDDKGPFGTELLRAQWPYIFEEVGIADIDQPAFDQLVYRRCSGQCYVFINEAIPLYPESTRELLRYVQAGNYVWMATTQLPSEMVHALGLAITRETECQLSDSIDVSVGGKGTFRVNQKDACHTFSISEDAEVDILGDTEQGEANYIKVAYGDGFFWLHSHPNLFGNYYVIDEEAREYVGMVLGQLPRTDSVLWDDYYKVANLRFRSDRRRNRSGGGGEGRGRPESRPGVLGYLLGQPALAWAFGLAMIGWLLYAVFEAKRKQRMIPAMEELPNTTLAFTRTIGQLYVQHGDHHNLALKRIRVLLEHIRQAYFLPTQDMDETFITQLAAKSGLPRDEVARLVARIQQVQGSTTLSDERLIDLNERIEWFYREGAR